MIKIRYHRKFQKSYRKRIRDNRKLDEVFRKRVSQFLINPECRELGNHRLVGRKEGLFSFRVTGDIRCIYVWIGQEEVMFLDIGSHNQVY